MHYVITLPNGRRCGLRAYVESWRALLSLPADELVRGFGHFPEPAREILAELRRAVHDRINRHDRTRLGFRKMRDDWQIETLRAAHAVNHPRLVIDWLPVWLRRRFADRLRRPLWTPPHFGERYRRTLEVLRRAPFIDQQ